MKPSVKAWSPGRTELAGNHTDHQQGRVLAGAVDRGMEALAEGLDQGHFHLDSAGFPSWTGSLEPLEPLASDRGTSGGLIRGMAWALQRRGWKVGGWRAQVTSRIPPGAGLSSSASFEILAGSIFNALYNENQISPLELAQAGQEAENHFFGKPCGLMDQCACALGGVSFLDFQTRVPRVKTLNLDLEAWGLGLYLVETGGSHADLTEDYAAVPREMNLVAQSFGVPVLRQVDPQEFFRALPRLKGRLPDRALLRALHFFQEDQRVVDSVAALEAQDIPGYLALVRSSGSSSWRFLQNVQGAGSPDQTLALALGAAEVLAGDQGAVRVHGGGFAGTLQAYVPWDLTDRFVDQMTQITGPGTVYPVKIQPQGAGARIT